MKKLVFVAALSVATLMAMSCGSTKGVVNEDVSKEAVASMDENNTLIQARKTLIVDWQDRTLGAKVNPEWLIGIIRGNGSKYVDMYGISAEYASHKWFCSSAQDASKETAQTIAETEVLYALASEMANTVNATVGSNLTDGQKDAVRTICSKVNNVKLTGVGNRGSYWQLEKITDEYGNTRTLYNWYALYSCSRSTYNQLLQVYLVELLKSKDLDKATINAIKNSAQQIIDDAQSYEAKIEEAKIREWKAQRIQEQNAIAMEHEKTLQAQAASNAEIAKNASPFASVNIQNGNSAVMNPALAALIDSIK